MNKKLDNILPWFGAQEFFYFFQLISFRSLLTEAAGFWFSFFGRYIFIGGEIG